MSNPNEVRSLILPRRRHILRAGLFGALGVGVVGRAAPPEIQSTVSPQASGGADQDQAAIPVVADAPSKTLPKRGDKICPYTLMGTGFANGTMVYYYEAFDCETDAMYIMTFSAIAQTGCQNPQASCQSNRGKPSPCASSEEGCRHTLQDTLLEGSGWTGHLSKTRPEFDFLKRLVKVTDGPNLALKKADGKPAVVAVCDLEPASSALKKIPRLGVGLEWDAAGAKTVDVDDVQQSPLSPYYYIATYQKKRYHVFVGKKS
jgi:hypothetical protein